MGKGMEKLKSGMGTDRSRIKFGEKSRFREDEENAEYSKNKIQIRHGKLIKKSRGIRNRLKRRSRNEMDERSRGEGLRGMPKCQGHWPIGENIEKRMRNISKPSRGQGDLHKSRPSCRICGKQDRHIEQKKMGRESTAGMGIGIILALGPAEQMPTWILGVFEYSTFFIQKHVANEMINGTCDFLLSGFDSARNFSKIGMDSVLAST
jgi:hypothetical protein